MAVSILRYGISVWGTAYETCLTPLQLTQNYIMKTILNKTSTYPTNLLYNEITNKLNIKGLYIVAILQYTHSTQCIRKRIEHGYDTRANIDKKLMLPKCKKAITQRYIDFLGPKLYNVLPPEIKNDTVNYKFRKKTVAHVAENFRLFVELMD